MKKFNFKLEGLLKLREFKEHKTKMELGEINRNILNIKNEITRLKKNIGIGYESQEALLERGTEGRIIQFYPYYTQAILKHIQVLKSDLGQQEDAYTAKLVELNRRKKELEVIEKLKVKEKEKFIKDYNKKSDAEIFDINLMRNYWNKT